MSDSDHFSSAIHAGGFEPTQFIETARMHGHSGKIGIRYNGHGDDWVELSFDWHEKLVGDSATGTIASGPIITLMDMASSLSIWVRSGRYIPQVTLDLRVDYLRPARPHHTVHGRCECYRMTRSIAFVRGQAHDGDPQDPLAHVAGTFIFLDNPA